MTTWTAAGAPRTLRQTTIRRVQDLAQALIRATARVEERHEPHHHYVLLVDNEIFAQENTLISLHRVVERPYA
jgi:hypothetical protein